MTWYKWVLLLIGLYLVIGWLIALIVVVFFPVLFERDGELDSRSVLVLLVAWGGYGLDIILAFCLLPIRISWHLSRLVRRLVMRREY